MARKTKADKAKAAPDLEAPASPTLSVGTFRTIAESLAELTAFAENMPQYLLAMPKNRAMLKRARRANERAQKLTKETDNASQQG